MRITTYDDLTLIDPHPVALDDELRRLCATFRSRPAGLRNTLTTNDFYVLLAFRGLLERERYRVEEVTLATSLPEAWFETPPRAAGVVTIHARHREDPEQLAIAFIAETVGAHSVRPTPTDVAAIVVIHENLL